MTEDSGFDELGVNVGNAIDLVGPNDTQVGHSDHFRSAFLHNRQLRHLLPVVLILLAHFLHPVVVYQVDKFQVTR